MHSLLAKSTARAGAFRNAASVSSKATARKTSSIVTMATSGAPEITQDPLMAYNWLCPYVHRVSLALKFKGQSVKEVDIDLGNKPAWMPELSPLGKVPTIAYLEGGHKQVLYESLVLVQWVEDYFQGKGPSLLPSSAADKALARIITSRVDSGVVGGFYKALRCASPEEFGPILKDLRTELGWLESHFDDKGPFILGAHATMPDCAIAPWILRTFVIEHYRKIDILEGFPKLKAYRQFLKTLPEVTSTFRPPAGSTWEDAMVAGYSAYGKEVVDMTKVAAA